MLALFLIVFNLYQAMGANILGIIPTPSYSHQAPFQPLWRELSLRGHQVTVMTTHPQKNASLINLTEIDMSYTNEIYEKYKVFHSFYSGNKSVAEMGKLLTLAFSESQEAQLSSPEVQNLINNKDVHFDLVIVEAQSPIMMAFSWKFKCPLIAVSSLDSPMNYHDAVGNIVHPIINPDFNLDIEDTDNMSFQQRLTSFIYIAFYKYYLYAVSYPRHHEQARRFFGEDLPSFIDLQNNISAMFVNTHPITHSVRPSNLNTISVGGGMHIKEPKPLPGDLKKYLDGARNGAIYFSLGSNVMVDMLQKNFTEIILKAFSEVPYKILLKLDTEIKELPKNVRLEKWVSQQDVLAHPNLKLFISHGGLQSLQESIYNGIPLISMPLRGDAFSNVNRMVKMGYGKRLDATKITKETLKETILEVVENPKYRQRAKELMEIFRDEEKPSLQRAIYWSEYVIKYNGARHLTSPLVGMPAWKYYMLDIFGCLSLVLLVVIYISYRIVKFILKKIVLIFISRNNSKTSKIHKD